MGCVSAKPAALQDHGGGGGHGSGFIGSAGSSSPKHDRNGRLRGGREHSRSSSFDDLAMLDTENNAIGNGDVDGHRRHARVHRGKGRSGSSSGGGGGKAVAGAMDHLVLHERKTHADVDTTSGLTNTAGDSPTHGRTHRGLGLSRDERDTIEIAQRMDVDHLRVDVGDGVEEQEQREDEEEEEIVAFPYHARVTREYMADPVNVARHKHISVGEGARIIVRKVSAVTGHFFVETRSGLCGWIPPNHFEHMVVDKEQEAMDRQQLQERRASFKDSSIRNLHRRGYTQSLSNISVDESPSLQSISVANTLPPALNKNDRRYTSKSSKQQQQQQPMQRQRSTSQKKPKHRTLERRNSSKRLSLHKRRKSSSSLFGKKRSKVDKTFERLYKRSTASRRNSAINASMTSLNSVTSSGSGGDGGGGDASARARSPVHGASGSGGGGGGASTWGSPKRTPRVAPVIDYSQPPPKVDYSKIKPKVDVSINKKYVKLKEKKDRKRERRIQRSLERDRRELLALKQSMSNVGAAVEVSMSKEMQKRIEEHKLKEKQRLESMREIEERMSRHKSALARAQSELTVEEREAKRRAFIKSVKKKNNKKNKNKKKGSTDSMSSIVFESDEVDEKHGAGSSSDEEEEEEDSSSSPSSSLSSSDDDDSDSDSSYDSDDSALSTSRRHEDALQPEDMARAMEMYKTWVRPVQPLEQDAEKKATREQRTHTNESSRGTVFANDLVDGEYDAAFALTGFDDEQSPATVAAAAADDGDKAVDGAPASPSQQDKGKKKKKNKKGKGKGKNNKKKKNKKNKNKKSSNSSSSLDDSALPRKANTKKLAAKPKRHSIITL